MYFLAAELYLAANCDYEDMQRHDEGMLRKKHCDYRATECVSCEITCDL